MEKMPFVIWTLGWQLLLVVFEISDKYLQKNNDPVIHGLSTLLWSGICMFISYKLYKKTTMPE